jgi:hypothetical protein
MFNRWTLGNVYDLKQDTYVLVTLLGSMLLLRKNKSLAFFLFGVATAIKHLTVFALPIFLFELLKPLYQMRGGWRSTAFKKEIGKSLLYGFLLILPILGPSIPYIKEAPRHYTNAILYNLTREAENEANILDSGFDKLLIRYNQDKNNTPFYYMLPRAPMLIAFLLLTAALFLGKIDKWKYSAFSFLIFVSFNPVLFNQYYVWIMAFLPFTLIQNKEEASP